MNSILVKRLSLAISILILVIILTAVGNYLHLILTGNFRLSEEAKAKIIEREKYSESITLTEEEKKKQEEVIQ